MKRNVFLLLLIFIILLTACGCENGASDTSGAKDGQSYNFIFVCPIIDNEYWQTCIDGIRQADEKFGVTTRVIGPAYADNFATNIVNYMQEAIDEKPDGIMAYAGIEAMYPLIEQASEAGIPVVSIDSDAPSTSRVAFVGTDTYNLGYKAGENMVELTGGTASAGILISTFSAAKEIEVITAFQDAISDYDIEIAAIEETSADVNIAEEKTRKLLSEHPEITAIFNTAGYNVTGAARVKKELGLSDLILIGFDDTEENLNFVRESVIDTLIVQNPEQMGYKSVRLLKEYLDNGSVTNDAYDTGTIIVNADNIDLYRE